MNKEINISMSVNLKRAKTQGNTVKFPAIGSLINYLAQHVHSTQGMFTGAVGSTKVYLNSFLQLLLA